MGCFTIKSQIIHKTNHEINKWKKVFGDDSKININNNM